LRVDREAHRPELHLQDWMVAVASLGRRGQADDVARLGRGDDALVRDRGDVVALVNDDVAVARDKLGEVFPSRKGLDHGDVDVAGDALFARADRNRPISDVGCALACTRARTIG
ncbi:MAG TPA: hypothetical protein VH143_27575, partial [Kofleriaceae bacterium]|nr:hypothetical protein [Kofleriaceae bacterium]